MPCTRLPAGLPSHGVAKALATMVNNCRRSWSMSSGGAPLEVCRFTVSSLLQRQTTRNSGMVAVDTLISIDLLPFRECHAECSEAAGTLPVLQTQSHAVRRDFYWTMVSVTPRYCGRRLPGA